MSWEVLPCEDCGGNGVDPGSLREPEACGECHGSGRIQIEMNALSHAYGQRKPVARATMPPVFHAGDVLEQKWRNGQ